MLHVYSHWHIPYLGYDEEKCHLSALDSGATGISAKDLSTSTVATIIGMAFSVLVAAAYRIRLKYFTTLEQHTNEVFMREMAKGVRGSGGGGGGGSGGSGGGKAGGGKSSATSSVSASATVSMGEEREPLRHRSAASFTSSPQMV